MPGLTTALPIRLPAATAAMMVPVHTAGIIPTCACRRVMTVAPAKANATSSDKPSPMGETLPVKDSDTMMATPRITTAMATQVATSTRSRNTKNDTSAAISGTPACISKILAMVVYCMAITKVLEAMAKHRPTPKPGRPMARNSLRVPCQPSRHSITANRNVAAAIERQKTTAQESGTVK